MPLYRITYKRTFAEFGRIEVEADSKDEAAEEADQMLSEDDAAIEWGMQELDEEMWWSTEEIV